MTSACIAIVPAGGSGQRYGQEKQYAALAGHTVLWHALHPLVNCSQITHSRVVVAADKTTQAQQALADYGDKISIIAAAGATRAASVYNGLQGVDDAMWALVHDAARPCLSSAACARLLHYIDSGSGDGAALALPVNEALKKVQDNTVCATIPRDAIWAMQTPQLFRVGNLRRALHNHPAAADEAEAISADGGVVDIIRGERQNIKITYPEDIQLAAHIINARQGATT